MASDNGLWAARVLQQALEGDPERADLTNVMAQAGIGFALLAIANAIEAHTEELKKHRTERN